MSECVSGILLACRTGSKHANYTSRTLKRDCSNTKRHRKQDLQQTETPTLSGRQAVIRMAQVAPHPEKRDIFNTKHVTWRKSWLTDRYVTCWNFGHLWSIVFICFHSLSVSTYLGLMDVPFNEKKAWLHLSQLSTMEGCCPAKLVAGDVLGLQNKGVVKNEALQQWWTWCFNFCSAGQQVHHSLFYTGVSTLQAGWVLSGTLAIYRLWTQAFHESPLQFDQVWHPHLRLSKTHVFLLPRRGGRTSITFEIEGTCKSVV